uniref:Uncharacterized protein n=1 Tax=Nelumbo nucifera TaxID=4432 RepID=A0A822XAX6_NELNU|nr:TPA_asm: hypothetical protein HUJ06_020027 [Nelumbo nucifera]
MGIYILDSKEYIANVSKHQKSLKFMIVFFQIFKQ